MRALLEWTPPDEEVAGYVVDRFNEEKGWHQIAIVKKPKLVVNDHQEGDKYRVASAAHISADVVVFGDWSQPL